MNHVNMRVKVSNVSESRQITTGAGVEHEIVEAEMQDETGSLTLVLWDDKITPIKVGDTLRSQEWFCVFL